MHLQTFFAPKFVVVLKDNMIALDVPPAMLLAQIAMAG